MCDSHVQEVEALQHREEVRGIKLAEGVCLSLLHLELTFFFQPNN